MLVIRLRRIGRTHDPHYRLVVTEHTAPAQGKFLTEVGHYHPKSKELVIQEAAFLDWIKKGAKPSNTVARLANRLSLSETPLPVKQFAGQPKKKAQAKQPTPQAQTAPADGSTADATPTETTTEGPAEPAETV